MANVANIIVVLPAGPPILTQEAAEALLALLLDAYAELSLQENTGTDTAA